MAAIEQPRRTWLVQHGFWLVLAALLLLALTPAALLLLDSPALEYKNSPFPVLSTPVAPGDVLALYVDRCIHGSEPIAYTFTRLMMYEGPGEPRTITIPGQGSNAPPGCGMVESRINTIPLGMPPGRYHLDAITTVPGRLSFFGAHLRSFSVPWQSAPFEVARNGR